MRTELSYTRNHFQDARKSQRLARQQKKWKSEERRATHQYLMGNAFKYAQACSDRTIYPIFAFLFLAVAIVSLLLFASSLQAQGAEVPSARMDTATVDTQSDMAPAADAADRAPTSDAPRSDAPTSGTDSDAAPTAGGPIARAGDPNDDGTSNSNSGGNSGTDPGNNTQTTDNKKTYVASYSLSVPALVRDKNNNTIPTADLTLTVTDERLGDVTDFSGATVTLTPHSGVFGAAPVTVGLSGSSYTVTFAGVQYFGSGQSFGFDITYSGLVGPQNGTLPALALSQTIGQCRTIEKADPAPEPAPEPDPTYDTPSLLVKSAVWSPRDARPGEAVDLTVTVLTGSGTENLADVFVALTLPEGLYAADGATGSLIGEMAPGGERTARFSLTLGAGADQAAQNVGIALSAVGRHSRLSVTGSGTATLAPAQDDRFTLLSAALGQLTVGQQGALSAQCVNMGRQAVYNVTAALLDEGGEQLAASYQGNLEGGTALDISLPIVPTAAAEYNWTFSLTYETPDGQSHTLLRALSGTVAAAVGTDTDLQSPVTQVYDLIRPKDSTSPPFWCWLLLIAGCVTALAKLVLGQLRTLLERKRYLQAK